MAEVKRFELLTVAVSSIGLGWLTLFEHKTVLYIKIYINQTVTDALFSGISNVGVNVHSC